MYREDIDLVSEEEAKVVPLKVIQGGRPAIDGLPPVSCWLKDLEQGTVFLAKEKQYNNYILGCFEIEFKTEKSVKLFHQTVTGQEVHLWVDPVSFSNMHKLFEVLGVRRPLKDGEEIVSDEIADE